MEAHPNEYVAQLLDRAANLITSQVDAAPEGEDSADFVNAKQWLQEYHAEKARFGQPLGSPAYSDAVQAARGENVETEQRQARAAAGTDTADAGTAPDSSPEEGSAYEGWTLEQLSEEAKRRGLPSSGTKADVRARLEENDAS